MKRIDTHRRMLEDAVVALSPGSTSGGALHPQFVEWMMGFPLGWTDLDGDDPTTIPLDSAPLATP